MLKWLANINKRVPINTLLLLTTFSITVSTHQLPLQHQESLQSDIQRNSNITQDLFDELKELARIADISYCVGTYGLFKPFVCTSHCDEFPNFELVDTFHSSISPGNNCGFIALDHGSGKNNGRILVVFRGTHSITDGITDLLVAPQEYVPYPPSPENRKKEPKSNNFVQKWRDINRHSFFGFIPRLLERWNRSGRYREKPNTTECTNCTVHLGFWQGYKMLRHLVLPQISSLQQKFPEYQLNVVGHSLGGAFAALAGLELKTLGYDPLLTTFGEPRLGNDKLRDYIDFKFNLRFENSSDQTRIPNGESRYRRVTHTNDPFPLLPTVNLGYQPHAGEIFITKKKVPPAAQDLRHCFGDDDQNCSGGKNITLLRRLSEIMGTEADTRNLTFLDSTHEIKKREMSQFLAINILNLYFAHIDYFSRMSLCLLPGAQMDWVRDEV